MRGSSGFLDSLKRQLPQAFRPSSSYAGKGTEEERLCKGVPPSMPITTGSARDHCLDLGREF